ncbi:MAG TPA: SGNH/GDSL hydrolase family protein [Candidatus Methylacidiphilales bacterium]
MKCPFTRDSRFLFIGDSITDRRRREDPEGLGFGFVRLIAQWILASRPGSAPQILNRGTNGHKITDLEGRWDEDVLSLKPDLVSVKIGVNDVWHSLDREIPCGTPLERYRSTYAGCLERLRQALPSCRIVLCEPSGIWAPANEKGNALLQPYIAAVADLAKEYDAVALVPFYQTLKKAKETRPEAPWLLDGVHPAPLGDTLLARTWLEEMDLL